MEFRELDDAEVKEFRQWAREHYRPGDPVNEMYHPVVQVECHEMNREIVNLVRRKVNMDRDYTSFDKDGNPVRLGDRIRVTGGGYGDVIEVLPPDKVTLRMEDCTELTWGSNAILKVG